MFSIKIVELNHLITMQLNAPTAMKALEEPHYDRTMHDEKQESGSYPNLALSPCITCNEMYLYPDVIKLCLSPTLPAAVSNVEQK